MTKNWLAIPIAAVKSLGLGEIPVGVVLSEEGCNILNKSAGEKIICQYDNEKKLGWACPLILKSRIGSPMVFDVLSFNTDGSWPGIEDGGKKPKNKYDPENITSYHGLIQISKSDVKSWTKKESYTPSNEPSIITTKEYKSASFLEIYSKSINFQQHEWLLNQCGKLSK